MLFSDLGLSSSLLKALSEQGYKTPTPIQAQAIPAVLQNKDVLAAAQTGTGKTAGFSLPILQKLSQKPKAKSNHCRALVLCPTRELAAQVGANVESYASHLDLRATVIFGGVKINPQMMKLRKGTEVLVATPGRLLDLYNQNCIHFNELEILVLDEADRMLDMGFIHDIKKILKVLPKQRQNLLFSATFSKPIRDLAKSMVNNPIEISVSSENTTAHTVKQWLIPVDKKQKSRVLTHLIKDRKWSQILVFTRTKHGANKLCKQLEEANIKSAAIHGNKSQGARTRALAEFKQKEIKVLVATDIAARGLDIEQLPQVVNFDLPNVSEDYVHRIGRTGRAGATGEAISLVSADEHKQLLDIERLIGKLIEREYESGFEPAHELPPSTGNFAPKRIKKPKTHKPNGRKSSGQQHSSQRRNDSGKPKRSGPVRNKAGNKKPHSAPKNKSIV